MASIQKFTDLNTWKKAHFVVLEIYEITKKFPKYELFGLADQMRRAAVSITSNIAEGFGRHTFKDKCHFYYLARGSMTELRNQLLIARDVSYITVEEYNEIESLIDTAQRLLHGLITNTTKNDRY